MVASLLQDGTESVKIIDGTYIYDVYTFPVAKLLQVPSAHKKKGSYDVGHNHRFVRYKNIITAFDIETTRIKEIEQSIMYIWQWQFKGIGCVIGRTWQEFIYFCEKLNKRLPKNTMIVVFDHNLSYEFQFLAGIYDFKPDDVFCIDNRKILYCNMYDRFQFRCSMLHANAGLRTYLKDYHAEHQKLEMDYTEDRYPWTVLDDNDLHYAINDVVGLCEAVEEDMKVHHDDLYTFSLTSTGNVRRILKRETQHAREYFVKPVVPDLHIHTLLREAYRGGNVHGNRLCIGLTLQNVHSVDESSAYIYAAMCDPVPTKRFTPLVENSVECVEEMIRTKNAVLFRVKFRNIHTRRHWEPCPYISRDKCWEYDDASFRSDNGRMLECDYILTTLTDVDYKIIKHMYEWESMEVIEGYAAAYGYLPNKIRDVLRDLYRNKTALKGVEGKEIEYAMAKALLNSCYGCFVQNPIRCMTLFQDGEYIDDKSKSYAELYEAYKKSTWSCYQWGVWITANSRMNLQEAIEKVNRTPGAQFVYCDTDSVKYRGHVDFTAINNKRIKACKQIGAFAQDPKGNIHYMGVFESEGTYEKFKTLGAKKYIYNYAGEDIKITIAGVDKKAGGKELQAKGGYDAFKTGFTFEAGGGTESIYNDDNYGLYHVDGHDIYISRNVVIRESTYTLDMTETYKRLIYSLDTIAGREQFEEAIKRLHTLNIYEN